MSGCTYLPGCQRALAFVFFLVSEKFDAEGGGGKGETSRPVPQFYLHGPSVSFGATKHDPLWEKEANRNEDHGLTADGCFEPGVSSGSQKAPYLLLGPFTKTSDRLSGVSGSFHNPCFRPRAYASACTSQLLVRF